MKVEAVQGNDKRRSSLVPMANGAIIGAGCGYIAKYAYPLTLEEKSTDEYISVRNQINNGKTAYNSRTANFIKAIKEKQQRSYAEDEFVKLFDGLKEGDHVKKGSIRSTLNHIQKEKPDALIEFKKLCKATSAEAEKTAKQCIDAYNLIMKHSRPTGFFLVAGAIIGSFIALIDDIIKVEVKN